MQEKIQMDMFVTGLSVNKNFQIKCDKNGSKNLLKQRTYRPTKMVQNFGRKICENRPNISVGKMLQNQAGKLFQKSNAINFCYELSEQYQSGYNFLQNSNLNVVKTSTEASTSCRDASSIGTTCALWSIGRLHFMQPVLTKQHKTRFFI